MLKTPEGGWIRDFQQLGEVSMSFFQELYTTTGPRNCQPVLSKCPSRVVDEMNEALVAEITMEEVRAAVFQSRASKAPGPDGINGIFY